jgi:PAS domain S-box-containing protein
MATEGGLVPGRRAPVSSRLDDDWRRDAGRAVAAGRALVACALTAAAALDPTRLGGGDALIWVPGLVWLPAAAVLLWLAERQPTRGLLRAGTAVDVGVLAVLHLLTPSQPDALLAVGLLVVAGAGYAHGWPTGVAAGAAVLAADLATGRDSIRNDLVEAVGYLAAAAAFDLLARFRYRALARARAAEVRAETILQRLPESIVVADRAGTVVAANPAAEQLVGGRSILGRTCLEVLRLGHGDELLDCSGGCPLLELASDGSVEVWRPRPDGSRQPLLAEASLVAAASGDEVVHVLRDITRLKEANEAKALFLASASHELKTPLTVIKGFAEVLLTNPALDDEARTAAAVIANRSNELGHVVARLLTTSRIQSGRAQVECRYVDLGEWLPERVALMNQPVEVQSEPHTVAWADPDALATVLQHLVDNAVKYSPEGGPVHVRMTAENGHVAISVTDEGIGMTAEEAERCFDKFWQADATHARRFGGTGLGLYIVRSLVDAMGGTVTVTSRPGHGSTFVVSLPHQGPLAPAEARAQAEATRTSEIREFWRQLGLPTSGRR